MADEEVRIAPVALPAGSFELRELEAALEHAVSDTNREKHPERIAKAIRETMVIPEILDNATLPAVPDGASVVEQKIVPPEGGEPEKRTYAAFDPVKEDDAPKGEKYHDRKTTPASEKLAAAEGAEKR